MQNNDLSVAMKLGMRRLASGVCVLTACNEGGERFAMTVSSVTSVSDSPASLLACINRQAALQEYLCMPDRYFAVNILSADQRDISDLCAGRAPDIDRFRLGDWLTGRHNLPYLSHAQSTFFCRSDQIIEYGTHWIVVGQIEEVILGGLEVNPLLYIDGGYATLNNPC